MKQIDKLIINSPYEEPKQYWEYIRDTREFVLQEGRRPAGYIVASVTMVGARSLLVAQVCANDTSRGNASKPIFITNTNRVLFHDKKTNFDSKIKDPIRSYI